MSNNIVEWLIIIPSMVILVLICVTHAAYKEYEGIREEKEYIFYYFRIFFEDSKRLKENGWVRVDYGPLCILYPGSELEQWLWKKKNSKFPSPDYIQNKSIKGFFKWLVMDRL